MQGIAYVNGRYLPASAAKVSIFDRANLFGDAVYEITCVLNGSMIDFPAHYARLQRSASEVHMRGVPTYEHTYGIHRKLVQANNVTDGLVYIQISRGQGSRDFVFPEAGTEPTVLAFTQLKPGLSAAPIETLSLKIITLPDRRWGLRDIKTIQLLYSSLARMEARKAGFDDAWLMEDEFVTEGTASNAYIVCGRRIITRNLGRAILPGVTRKVIIDYAKRNGMEIEERPFTLTEAYGADEAFSTSATSFVAPVVRINSAIVGGGLPGPVTRELRSCYLREAVQRGST